MIDIYKPNGAWKVEPNGTYVVTKDNKQVFIEYAQPVDVPGLMQELIDYISQSLYTVTSENAGEVYARIHAGIAHIHPFWDGNGRIARLVANLPLQVVGVGRTPIN